MKNFNIGSVVLPVANCKCFLKASQAKICSLEQNTNLEEFGRRNKN